MIKPEELRIGNYFYTRVSVDGILMLCDYIHFRVSVIGFSGVRHSVPTEKESYSFPFHRIEPIKINERWLKRLGFKHMESGVYIKDELTLITNEKGSYIKTAVGAGFLFDYVHELQNIYYVLTKTDLKDISEEGRKTSESEIRGQYQKQAAYYTKAKKD